MIKKGLKIFGILFLVIIVAAIAIPYFFKDQIVEAVKEDINKSLNAKVDFEDVSLSLFRSFPDFSFSLDKLSITGIEEFEGYKLVNAENIDLSLDLMSVISSDRPIEINSVSLVQPEINIKVLRNGKANYDIVKPSDTEETAESDLNFLVQLEEYSITDGKFLYDDRQGGTFLEILDLDHTGQGAFTQDIFDLSTKTQIGSLTTKSGGIAYLNKAKGDLDLIISVDLPNSKYTIKENEIVLNALKLNSEGFVQMIDDKINIDLKYNAPKNNFKNFLSMIPSAYTADYQDVEANGGLEFNGFVKGNYNLTTGSLPAFQVNLKVDNGDFKYPDLPLGISGINTITKINSPSSDFNKMVIDVSQFKMKIGNNPFEASVKLWTLLSDPNIDAKINGKIDLQELSKAFPIEGVNQFNGIITSNLTAKTSMSAIDKQDFDNVDMVGDVRMESLYFSSDDYPDIQVKDMHMGFSPQFVKLDKFDAIFGKSDIQAQGTIDNVLAYFTPDKTMTGNVKMRSSLFDSNEWMAESTDEASPTVAETEVVEDYEVFERFDFTVDAEIDKLLYDVYELKNSKLIGQVTPHKATVQDFKTNIGESDFRMSGKITNIFNYLYENETLGGNINLASNYINANEFMVEPPSGEPQAKAINETAAAEMEVIPVPEKMNIDINADIGKVLYTNIELKDINGKMKVADETVTMKDCTAKALGGSFVMNGTYDTKDTDKPKFDMDYKVNRLDFQNAFDKLNTFQALAPIGKFIEGKFNTTLKLSGELGKDMMPDLSSLSANGFLQTIDGTLKNFKPIEKFADKLNINFLKSINLKNTKNWFELNDGKVTIKDFDLKTSGIDMTVGGTHGLNTDMDYNINAKVPRKILQQNAVGQAADKGLKFLQGQASKLGINIDQGEFVNVAAQITGTMTDPKIKLNLIGADGKAANLDNIVDNIKDQAVDKASDVIKDKTGVDVKNIENEVKEAKEDLSAKADAEIASLMEKTDKTIAKLKSEAEQKAQQTREEAKKLADKAKVEGYKQADQLIEKAGSNPFKKKAAEIAAKKLKSETDKKAEQIIEKGDVTANGIIKKADEQAVKLKTNAENQAEGIRKKYQ